MKRFQLSTIAISIVAITCFLIDLDFKNWREEDRVIEWDIHSYYAYLPAYFIYNDIKLVNDDYRFSEKFYLFWPTTTENGGHVIKTSMGLAVLYAPFFFVADAFAHYSHYSQNGFSEPYKIFLLISTIFYLIIGLDFLRKILRHYKFSDTLVSFTILLIGLGTNLLCYSSQSAPMPHVYNFCLFAVFMYSTIKWYHSQSIKNSLVIGFLLGLISLIRPTNLLILIFFILFEISNLSDLKERMKFFLKKIPLILVMIIPVVIVWLPQCIYWKTVSDSYFFYSYPGERFFFNDPKIIDGLFSFRKGWLVYTPMMIFSLIGYFFMENKIKKLRFSLVLFFILNIYIIFSWWCWWYGGTFGQRSMVDSYAVMALPFASFIKYISEKKWYSKVLFTSIALFFIWLNVFQTYQKENGTLHHDGMTKELYFKQFGTLERIPNFYSLVKPPDYDKAKVNDYSEPTPGDAKRNYNDYNGADTSLITLKASNNKYVSAEYDYVVISDKEKASTWETFTLVKLNENKCALKAYNNFVVCAELNKKGEITASRKNVSEWETFKMVKLENDFVAFKAYNDKYFSLDLKSFHVFASSDTIGKNEKFLLTAIK